MADVLRNSAIWAVGSMLLLASAGSRAAIEVGGAVDPAPTAETFSLADLELVVIPVPGTTAIRFSAPPFEIRAFTEPTDPREFNGRGFLTRGRATFDGDFVRSINSDLTCSPGVCTNEGEGMRFVFAQPVSEFVVYFEGGGAGPERLRLLESFDENGASLESTTVDLSNFDFKAVLPVVFRAEGSALSRVEISDASDSDSDNVRIFDIAVVTPFEGAAAGRRVPLPGPALGLLALVLGGVGLCHRRFGWRRRRSDTPIG